MKTERYLRNHSGQSRRASAFTCRDLMALLACLALLMAVALPLLAGNRASSDRAVCQSNLRQIGRAMNMWADDHGGKFHYQVPGAEGGSVDSSLANNSWVQFIWIKAELETPKILVCPTDADKIPAADWSNASNGGFNYPSSRNRAVSYLLGLGIQHNPRGFLSSDRNIRPTNPNSGGCLSGPAYAGTPALDWQSPTLNWTDQLHNRTGNILLNDGSVIPAGQSELRTAVKNSVSASDTTLCVLYPN